MCLRSGNHSVLDPMISCLLSATLPYALAVTLYPGLSEKERHGFSCSCMCLITMGFKAT